MRVDQYEKHSFLGDLLDSNSVVVDLGSNRGHFALGVIGRYGCQVLGVEPVPSLVSQMPRHERLRVVEAAVTARDALIALHVNPTLCASTHHAEPGAETIDVRGITLERLLAESGMETTRVSLMKVDIEGAEIPLLLSSSTGVLDRIDQISVEFHDFLDPTLASSVRAVDARLQSLGFRRFAFSRDNSDVLYLHSSVGVTRRDRVVMLMRYKYLRGAVRFVRRIFGSRRER